MGATGDDIQVTAQDRSTDSQAPVQQDGWKEGMTRVTVLYRMAECGDVFPLVNLDRDVKWIEPTLTALLADGLLKTGKENWEITEKGREVLGKIQQMTDHALQFEIFGAVRLAAEVPDELWDDEKDGQVLEHVDDPRFDEGDDAEDMRIAMLTFLGEHLKDRIDGPVDPYQLVYLQKLGTGQLKSETFWTELGSGMIYDAIEEIVTSAYQWRWIADDVESAADCMLGLRTAGLLQLQKSEGDVCSNCEARLAFVFLDADICPFCKHVFGEPEPEVQLFNCANCQAEMTENDSACPQCGTEVDWGLQEGQVSETTTEETVVEEEEVYDDFGMGWSCGYGYDPYGYYDPYDPYIDAVAFGCLAVALW